MATTALQIINDARVLLKDDNATAWDDATLLAWVNAGQREISSLRPDAYTKFATVTTVNGTRQSLPADGIILLHVPRNIVAGIPGRAIRKVGRDQLDSVNPDWHSDTPNTQARNFVYDTFTPKAFYLYPPSVAGSTVEVIYGAVPIDLTSIESNIVLDDSYRNPLTDYVLFRAYSEDMEIPSAGTRAAAHRQLFDAFLGRKANADASSAAAQVAGS